MTSSELEFVMDLMGSPLSRYSSSKNRPTNCPLAPYTNHRRGTDNKPSCMVTTEYFKCWGCGEDGKIRTLARKFAEHSGDWRAYNYVVNLEGGEAKGSWGKINVPYGKVFKKKKTEEAPKEMTEEFFQSKYLKEVPDSIWERGVTMEQAIRWELRFDPYDRRLILPVRDYKQKLMGVSGRDALPIKIEHLDERPKYKHYCFKKEYFLYGERFVDFSIKRAFIVEGFFDVFNMERYGLKNVLSPFGTSLSFEQLKKLRDWFDEIIFLPDANDDGQGLKFAEESVLRLLVLNKKVRIAGVKNNPCHLFRMNPPRWEATDHRFMVMDELVGKDPGEWTSLDLKLAFQNVGTVELKGGIVHSIGALDDVPVEVHTRPKDILSDIFS